MTTGIDPAMARIGEAVSVECKLCGRRFRTLAIHLRKWHGVTIHDYEGRFPGAPVRVERAGAR